MKRAILLILTVLTCIAGLALVRPVDWTMMRGTALAIKQDFYRVEVLQQHVDTALSFPYQPLWAFDAFVLTWQPFYWPLYVGTFVIGLYLLRGFKDALLVAGVGCGLLLTFIGGNIAITEFVFICLVFRLIHENENDKAGWVLGIVATMKLLPLTFFIGLPRRTVIYGFLSAFALGFIFFYWQVSSYFHSLLGLWPQHSAAGEIILTGFNNQSVWHYPPLAVFAVAYIAIAWTFQWHYFRREEKLAYAMLAAFLLFPRIPPYTYLPYAAVPILVLYQRALPVQKWLVIGLQVVCAGCLALMHFGLPIPTNVQWLCVFASFLVLTFKLNDNDNHA